MRQHNYLPQRNEPNQVARNEADNLKKEALAKVVKITVRLILCVSILNVISFCGVFYNYLKQQHNVEHLAGSMLKSLQSMSANLNNNPILDIQIMNYGSACPSGLQAEILGAWPGTVPGCLCENGDLHKSTCEEVNSEKCKKEIKRTFPIDMYEWEDSVFCVKRAVLGDDYLKQVECPSGYKACYPGGCFNGGCPVTKVEITSSPEEKTNKFGGREKYLIATNQRGELPLINIQISLDDIPCFTQDLSTQYIVNSYKLSPLQEDQCDKYGLNSQFSTELDSQTAYESFTQNSFSYFVMKLPDFEENANKTTSILSSMVRMKTAKHDHCLNIDTKSISNLERNWNGPAGQLYLAFIFVLGILQLLGGFFSLLEIRKPSDFMGVLKILFFPNRLLYIFLFLSELVWYFFPYRYLKILKEEMEGYDSLDCFEGGQGSLVISDYLEEIRDFEAGLWGHYGAVIFGVSFILITFWYEREKRRIKRM